MVIATPNLRTELLGMRLTTAVGAVKVRSVDLTVPGMRTIISVVISTSTVRTVFTRHSGIPPPTQRYQ